MYSIVSRFLIYRTLSISGVRRCLHDFVGFYVFVFAACCRLFCPYILLICVSAEVASMELHVWPSDFGLPSIDPACLQFLVSLLSLYLQFSFISLVIVLRELSRGEWQNPSSLVWSNKAPGTKIAQESPCFRRFTFRFRKKSYDSLLLLRLSLVMLSSSGMLEDVRESSDRRAHYVTLEFSHRYHSILIERQL